ncbi:hypothetical protein IFM12275_07840 [Nocardia sputorum]|uniref:Uncharacterized protein n=1 Tax=Nocardia sputorum TaxID=2984338 RepID=A0ABM8CWS8_9NOCA|nr:hypothetical protein IFM12275_07840 [Nocardia sputorum]BDT99441.1 hypothetical protein IFM12276_24700 [Nocardia sputorum]
MAPDEARRGGGDRVDRGEMVVAATKDAIGKTPMPKLASMQPGDFANTPRIPAFCAWR